MKKAIASALVTAAYYAYTAPLAFAAPGQPVDLDPCQNINPNQRTGFEALCAVNAGGTGTMIQNIIFAILVIATIVALFFLIWGGFKWVTSGGDKSKVDAARSTIIAAIVGLIIAFLAFFILTIVLGFFGISFSDLEIPTIKGS